jgi:hypothetical protein
VARPPGLLKQDFQPLDLPRGVGAADGAKAELVVTLPSTPKIRVVQNIEEFRSELHSGRFP